MPYKLFKKNGKVCVKNSDTGENKGCSDSRDMAVKHMRALYAAEGGAKMGKKEGMTDEMVDALVNEAVLQFEQEYPDESHDPETKEKSMHYSDAGWLRPGLTSFAELEQAMAEEERVGEMRDLISAYPTLASNILWSPDIEDKPTALKALADELGERLQNVSTEKEMKPNFFERIVSAVKERLQPTGSPGSRGKEAPEPDNSGMMIFKEGDQYRWICRYSNNFRDRDRPSEILSAESHRNFVEMVDKGLAPYPELWLWHVPEWKIGQATWVSYDDAGFAMAAGYFDKGREAVAEWLSTKEDIAVSHGMPPKSVVRDGSDPSVIVQYQTAEISPLPSWAAANALTSFSTLTKEADMAIPAKKREYLIKDWGIPEEALASLEAVNELTATSAKELGLESKESEAVEQAAEPTAEATVEAEVPAEETPAVETPAEPATETKEEDPQNGFPTRKEVAEAVVNIFMPTLNKQNEAIESVLKQVSDLAAVVASMQKTDEEKVANLAKETPMASLSAMISGIIGNPAAEVDGRESLAKSKPKETEAPAGERPPTPVPFINSMITPAGK